MPPYVFPIIAAIVGVAIVALIVIVTIQMNRTKPTQTTLGPVDLFQPKTPVIIGRDVARANMSATYTLSFYLRVDAVPDMRAGATPLLMWPGIWNLNYNAPQESLEWDVRQTASGSALVLPEKIALPKVPMQRWNQITAAFEGRTFDLFVNGALVKSHSLTNMPPSANSSITIVPGGILGQIAYVQLWPRRLTIAEAGANYVDTSDSQGRPFIGPGFSAALANIQVPNLFCPSGNCGGTQPTATPSQTWEFPYA